MYTLSFDYEVDTSRQLEIKLPPAIETGRHRFQLVIDPVQNSNKECADTLQRVAHEEPPQTALWSQLTALRQQAKACGTLPPDLTIEAILAEVEQRRGDRNG